MYVSFQHAPTCQVLGPFVLRKPFPGPGPAGCLLCSPHPGPPPATSQGLPLLPSHVGLLEPLSSSFDALHRSGVAASSGFPRECTGGSAVRLDTSTGVLVCLHHHPVLLDGVVGFPTSIQLQIVEFSFRVLNALLKFLHFQCYYWNLDTIVFPDSLYKTCFIFSGTL